VEEDLTLSIFISAFCKNPYFAIVGVFGQRYISSSSPQKLVRETIINFWTVL
jgi:hypothetical protein